MRVCTVRKKELDRGLITFPDSRCETNLCLRKRRCHKGQKKKNLSQQYENISEAAARGSDEEALKRRSGKQRLLMDTLILRDRDTLYKKTDTPADITMYSYTGGRAGRKRAVLSTFAYVSTPPPAGSPAEQCRIPPPLYANALCAPPPTCGEPR